MSDFSELARRLEDASEPDRKLDAEIDVAVRAGPGAQFPSWIYTNFPTWRARDDGRVEVVHSDGKGGVHWTPRPYTKSIDAACTLIPTELDWRVDTMTGLPGAIVAVPNAWLSTKTAPRLYHAATPALALCVAALRALCADHVGRTKGGS